MRLALVLGLTVLVIAGVWIGSPTSGDSGEPASASPDAGRRSVASDPVASDPSARFGTAPERRVQKPDVGRVEAELVATTRDLSDATSVAPAPAPSRPPRTDRAERADAVPDLVTISPLELAERWSGYDYDYVREIWAYVDGEIKVFGSRGGGFRALHAQLGEDLVRSEPWTGPLPEPQLNFTVIDGSGRTRELSVGEWWISDGQRLAVIDEARAQHYLALMEWRLGRPGPSSPEDFAAGLAARTEAYRQGPVTGGLDSRPNAPMPTLSTAP